MTPPKSPFNDLSDFTVKELQNRAKWLGRVAETRANEPGVSDRFLAEQAEVLSEVARRAGETK